MLSRLNRRSQFCAIHRYARLEMMIACGETDEPKGKPTSSTGDRHISRIAGNRGAFFVTQTTNFHIGAEILMLAGHHQSLLGSFGRALTPDSPAVSGLRSATPPRLWRSVGFYLSTAEVAGGVSGIGIGAM